ncbi:MAG: NYN domain-containing protein [Actinobacteria bacterium]|nr:NYN domain-containing protein [Actinomycetota bacterium]
MTARGQDVEVPVLVEPARQRLITVAAEVLGRLEAGSVPGALRPVARFAAAKRARLGATALSAAIDLDPAFRQIVADTVAESSPQLAEAVRTAGPTGASDPIDVAVVAYLLRPPGWVELVTAANARYTSERGPAERDDRENARLRAEVGQLRAQVRSDAAQARSAAATARADANAETAELRRQLRTQVAQSQAAARRVEAAESARAAAEAQVAAAESARDSETRRLRSRVSELERALELARRSARGERDLDDARLWLLVETLTEAAAGVRRELSLTPPTRRPADGVAEPQVGRVSRQVDDGSALERLLALPHVHLIVDGYNVTKSGYEQLPLADQRRRLIGQLARLGTRTGAEVTIVFDGSERPPALPAVPRGVRVLFSEAGIIADDLIRQLLAAEPPGRPLVVVSSDQAVAMDVRRAGAWSVSSSVLLNRLDG